MRLGAAGIRRAYTATENQYHLNIGVKSPLVKVLKVLRKLFQKFSESGSGQSPEVFPLPVRIAKLNGAVEIAGKNQL